MAKTAASVLTESEASAKRKQLIEMKKTLTDANLAMAKLLFDIYFSTTRVANTEVPLVTAWGFESFDDYAETELEIHHGQAENLVRVYDELCVRRNLPENYLPNSVPKLKNLAKISRADRAGKVDFKQWVKDARDMTPCELDAAVEKALGGRVKKKNFSFFVQWTRAKTMMKTVEEAKEVFGAGNKGDALAYIVEEWDELRKKTTRLRKKVG